MSFEPLKECSERSPYVTRAGVSPEKERPSQVSNKMSSLAAQGAIIDGVTRSYSVAMHAIRERRILISIADIRDLATNACNIVLGVCRSTHNQDLVRISLMQLTFNN